MLNSIVKQSLLAGGIAFALCLVSMLAGGLTWLTGAAGWVLFLAMVFSAVVGWVAFNLINLHHKQDWLAERRSVIERMEDAQACIKAEERAHGTTKRALTESHEKLQQTLRDYQSARTDYENTLTRCRQKDTEIRTLRTQLDASRKENFSQATDNANKLEEIRQQVQADNDTWRKQVSNMRSAAMDLYKALDDMKFSNDDLDAVQNLMDGLLSLAEAGGVPVIQDERQIPIEGTTTVEAEIEAVAGPTSIEELQAEVVDSIERVHLVQRGIDAPKPTTGHPDLDRLMSQVRKNQHERRARLDLICKAVEQGYDLSAEFVRAYHRGMMFVTDDLIRSECELIGQATRKGER